MNTLSGKTTFAAFGISLAAATAGHSLTLDEIKERDFNGNGHIEPGREQDALIAVFEQLTSHQQALAVTAVNQTLTGVKVSEFVETPDVCNVKNRLRLRKSLSDFSVVENSFISAAGEGARFHYSSDNIANLSSWFVEGAIFWVFGDLCPNKGTGRGSRTVSAVAYGFAPYLEFSGSRTAGVTQNSSLRTGVVAQTELFGGRAFQTQLLSISPYYQTDFYGEANIVGLTGSWKPVNLDIRLNGHLNKPFWWNFDAVLDYFDVRDGGRIGLTSGMELGWAGINLGASYVFTPDNTNGFYGSITYSSFHDVVNGDHANKATARVGAYLSETKASSIELSYTRGTDYRTLVREEGTAVSLSLRF